MRRRDLALTVLATSVSHGALSAGQAVIGPGITRGNVIIGLGTGRNGTGDYTVHFASAMFNTGYAVCVSNNGNTADPIWASVVTTNVRDTRFTIRRGGAFSGATFDASKITVMVAGLGGYT